MSARGITYIKQFHVEVAYDARFHRVLSSFDLVRAYRVYSILPTTQNNVSDKRITFTKGLYRWGVLEWPGCITIPYPLMEEFSEY